MADPVDGGGGAARRVAAAPGHRPGARALDRDALAPRRGRVAALGARARARARGAAARRRSARARGAAHRHRDYRGAGRRRSRPRAHRARRGARDRSRPTSPCSQRSPRSISPTATGRSWSRRCRRWPTPPATWCSARCCATARGRSRRSSSSSAPQARASYKIALNDDMTNLPAAASLSSLALMQEDWGELARVLVAEADLVDDPRTQRRLCERAGDLYWERLGDAENAIGAYRRAALATPDEAAPLRKLAAVLESNARWRELVDVYVAELPLTKDLEERADLYHRIGEVYEVHLGRGDDAVGAYRSALEAVPTHMPTLQALGALYRAAERWSDLADMDLREAERIGDPERRAARYFDVADLVERRLGDQPHAISLYERCLDLVPGHRAAFAALDALYRREERWRDIVAIYERQAQAVSDPKLVRYYKQEIGRLWRERVPNADKAAQAYREALADRRARPRAADPPGHDARAGAALGDARRRAREDGGAARREGRSDRDAAPPRARARDPARSGREGAGRARARARARGRPTRRRCARSGGCTIAPAAGSTSSPATASSCRWPTRPRSRRRCITASGACTSASSGGATTRSPPTRCRSITTRRIGRRCARSIASCAAIGCGRACSRCSTSRRAPRGRRRRGRSCTTRAGRSSSCTCAISRRPRSEYAQAVKLSSLYEAAVAALGHVREARGEYGKLEELYTDLLARTQTAAARVSVLSRLGPLYELRLQQPARAALAYREAYEASPLGQPLRLAELRATRLEGGGSSTVQPLAALGQRTSDKRLALGYRTLAAVRDEVSAQKRQTRPSSQLYLDAAGLGQQDPGVADGVVRTLERAPAPDSTSKERLPGAHRRARGDVRLGAGAGAALVRGGVPVRSRRARARRRARLRAGGQRGQRFSARAARGAAHRRRQRAVVGGGGAARARGRGRGRRGEPRRRAARRRRDRAQQVERVARGAASLQAPARAAADRTIARSTARWRCTRSSATSRACSSSCKRARRR